MTIVIMLLEVPDSKPLICTHRIICQDDSLHHSSQKHVHLNLDKMQDLTPPFHFKFEKKKFAKVKKVRDLPIGLSIPYNQNRAYPKRYL